MFLVLMYSTDPAATLRCVLRFVRARGVLGLDFMRGHRLVVDFRSAAVGLE